MKERTLTRILALWAEQRDRGQSLPPPSEDRILDWMLIHNIPDRLVEAAAAGDEVSLDTLRAWVGLAGRHPGERVRVPPRHGAVRLPLEEGDRWVVFRINQVRRDGRPVFEVPSGAGCHLMTAGEIRASWDAWVADLVQQDEILQREPEGPIY